MLVPSLISCAGLVCAGVTAADGPAVRLVVRGDDMGSCHTANVACVQCFRDGIMRTVEVMVPGPWYPEAVQMLAECPGLDVGVHLTLTSEWSGVKWGPLTHAPSLVDALGHFRPMNSQRDDFPPDTGFLEARPDLAEVEAELRAQIERALADIKGASHLSTHMGTPLLTPELAAIADRLSREYGLPLGLDDVGHFGGFGEGTDAPEQRAEALAARVRGLEPGTWLLIEHPGLDTDEMRAMGHVGYEHVANDRAGVTAAFTSPGVRAAIDERGIGLLSYADLLRE